MLIKCKCGKYTDYGITCISCTQFGIPDLEEIPEVEEEILNDLDKDLEEGFRILVPDEE